MTNTTLLIVVLVIYMIIICLLFWTHLNRKLSYKQMLLDKHDNSIEESNKIALSETKSVVLIEGRKHKLMKACIQNIRDNLPHWKIHVVGTNYNKEFIKTLNNIDKITILPTDKFNVDDYNTLVTSLDFWKNIVTTDRVLLYQTDSWICHNSKYKIEDYFQYDYVGAPWTKFQKEYGNYVGNCGFSLIKVSSMINLLNTYSVEEFKEKYKTESVDIFFGLNMINKPHKNIAKTFSVENIWYDRPFGVHKPFKLNSKMLNELECNCKGVSILSEY